MIAERYVLPSGEKRKARAWGVNVALKAELVGRKRVKPPPSPFFSFSLCGDDLGSCVCLMSLSCRLRLWRFWFLLVMEVLSTLSRPILYRASVKVLNSRGMMSSKVRAAGGGRRTESM